GRRHPLQRPVGGRPALHSRDDRRAARRDEGSARGRGRLPREHGELKSVLRDLKHRGMSAPVFAVGDGARGFWAAVRDAWPKTREQRDWFHKLGNILDKLPKRLQPRVKARSTR